MNTTVKENKLLNWLREGTLPSLVTDSMGHYCWAAGVYLTDEASKPEH